MSQENHNHTCLVRVPIFNHLELEELTKITDLIRSKTYHKGDLIFSYGQKSDTLYILKEGQIKTYHLSDNAKEHILKILHPGDFIGDMGLFLDEEHTAYAEAMTKVIVCTIKKADISKLMTVYPNIGLKIIGELSHRLKQSQKQSSWIANEQVEKRIALYLLEYYDKNKPNKSIDLTMTKKDLASFLGTTPETLSRKLALFEDLKLINQVTHKKIIITNYEGLMSFINQI